MVNRLIALKLRKIHRYFGLFIGIQFLMWTCSGLYFSWSDIDEIHGDNFKKEAKPIVHSNLLGLNHVFSKINVYSLELKTIAGNPYYWVNDSILLDSRTGVMKSNISEKEALIVAAKHMRDSLEVKSVDLINSVDNHHEYRGRPLPAYVIAYDHPDNVKAYVSSRDGAFQRVRYSSWRWFDFLWMTHTMDYEGRDNINNLLLRIFSLLGLLTVLSGFLLWYVSSPTVRKIFKKE